jgi:pimeloyl-ACP methyl ester carboxylesterase
MRTTRPPVPARAVVPPLVRLLVVLLLATLLAGCSRAPEEPSAVGTSPPDPTQDLRDSCLSAIPEEAGLSALTLAGATDGTISAGVIGPAGPETVAVLLPQVSGMCGWGRYATALAADAGVTSLLLDPCGYGESRCSDAGDDDPLNEVAPAVAHARDVLGARRVVLVGTSMGGSLTVLAAAAGAEVDGWVDVSGPPRWEETDLADLADDLPSSGMVVMARTDGDSAYRQSRTLARVSGAVFVDGGAGHGWELLSHPVSGRTTRVGARVMDFVAGRAGS